MKTLVDSGALTMALNVLRRAGKDEVADALQATAVRDDGQQPVGRLLVVPGDSWPTLTREGDEALWDLPPGEYKLYLRPQTGIPPGWHIEREGDSILIEAPGDTLFRIRRENSLVLYALAEALLPKPECPTCQDDGAGPFDCYDCGRKAQNSHKENTP